jgi:hypothetical protein
MVWASLLGKPLEVVRRRPHRTLAIVRVDQDASHIRATHLPVLAIIVDGHGCGPLRALFAPHATAFDALLGTVSGDVGRCLLVTTWGCLHASLSRAKHDC